MIGGPIPDPRRQVIEQLNASIDQFFASGRQSVIGKPPTLEPRRVRPIAADALAGTGEQTTPKPGSRAELSLVRELAKSLSFGEAIEASGIPRPRLLQLSKAHLITFQASSTERRARDAARQRREARIAGHCEQLRALAGTGITRHEATKQIGISYGYLARLLDDYGIDFPIRGGMK